MQIIAIHLDKEVYQKAKELAYKRDQPVKNWIAQCVDRAVMNWKDPVTKKRVKTSSGLECMVCGCDSYSCRYPDNHKRYEWTKPSAKAVAASS